VKGQLLVTTANVDRPRSFTRKVYEEHGGYTALRKALSAHKPDEIIEMVKTSGLRGRGGAGFPAGMKWGFVPKKLPKPRYVVCNADESEPGTFKDRVILERDPHLLVEGCILAAYAVESHQAYIYIRGEYGLSIQRVSDAVREAYAAGYLGRNILGSGYDCDLTVYAGAGAYICGEETGLLDSLEGKRGHPRLKPPFPAVAGLYGCPTVINNVETLASVPMIVNKGGEWFAGTGVKNSSGPRIFAVSGHVNKPGLHELEMGKVTFRELIEDHCGGMRNGRSVKAVIPGGASTPILSADELDTPMDFDSIQAAGSFMGSTAVIVMDDTTCIIHAVLILTRFFAHESCGQCTPCREGTHWAQAILERFERGGAKAEEIDVLMDMCGQMGGGRTICALADGAIMPIRSSIQKWRGEYEAHVETGCPQKGELCEVAW
jgi:NADH-quinone oxidoreductase subunit F